MHHQLEALGIGDADMCFLSGLGGFPDCAVRSLALIGTLNSKQRVKTLVTSHPELLCVPLDSWLDFLTSYGVSRRDFFRLLSANPLLFTRGNLFNAGSAIAFLQSLGLSPRDIAATVIPRCSDLLLLDVQAHLAPAAAFLAQELALDRAGVRDLLCRCPRVMSPHAASQLAPTVQALRAAGLAARDVSRLLQLNSSLLLGDAAAVLACRTSFLTAECGFTKEQALSLLAGCPQLLSLTRPNLQRKWRFLTQRMRCGPEQVLEYPQFWSKSLLLDIGPRFSYVTDRRLLATAASSSPAPDTCGGGGSGDGSAAASSGGSSTAASSGGGGGGRLSLRVLLDSNDVDFVEAVWRAGRGRADAAAAASGGDEVYDDEVDVDAPDSDDYDRFRASWLETEGVRWSGVNAVGAAAVGSW